MPYGYGDEAVAEDELGQANTSSNAKRRIVPNSGPASHKDDSHNVQNSDLLVQRHTYNLDFLQDNSTTYLSLSSRRDLNAQPPERITIPNNCSIPQTRADYAIAATHVLDTNYGKEICILNELSTGDGEESFTLMPYSDAHRQQYLESNENAGNSSKSNSCESPKTTQYRLMDPEVQTSCTKRRLSESNNIIESESFSSLNYATKLRKYNHWTSSQKQTVCILQRWYTNHWSDIAKLFNFKYGHALRNYNYPQGMSGQVIQASYYAMAISKSEIFERVFGPPFNDLHGAYLKERNALEKLGLQVGIELVKRPRENMESLYGFDRLAKKKILRKQKRERSVFGGELMASESDIQGDSNSTEDDSDSKEDEDEDLIESDLLERQSHKKPKRMKFESLQNLQQHPDQKPRKQNLEPKLLFRSYTSLSQGINTKTIIRSSASLLKEPCPIVRPDIYPSQLLPHVERHVRGDQHPSPLISTSSLLWALHKSTHPKIPTSETAYIVVIDASRLSGLVHHAQPLIYEVRRQRRLQKQTNYFPEKYQGAFEYFFCHEIPQSAIVKTLTLADFGNLEKDIPFLRMNVIQNSSLESTAQVRRFLADKEEQSRYDLDDLRDQVEIFGHFLLDDHSDIMRKEVLDLVEQNWELPILSGSFGI